MNTERETQIRELLAKNPKLLEEAVNRLQNALGQTVADLHIKLFPYQGDDEEGMDVIKEIFKEILMESLRG